MAEGVGVFNSTFIQVPENNCKIYSNKGIFSLFVGKNYGSDVKSNNKLS